MRQLDRIQKDIEESKAKSATDQTNIDRTAQLIAESQAKMKEIVDINERWVWTIDIDFICSNIFFNICPNRYKFAETKD